MKRIYVCVLVAALVFNVSIGQDVRPSNAYVELEIAGSVSEKMSMLSFFFPQQMTVRGYLELMEKARLDDTIGGLLIKINSTDMGWAKMEQLRRKVLEFRQSGKKTYALLKGSDIISYILASSCDEIAMTPQSMLLIPGLNAEVLYFKDLFAKLGIQFEEVHMGKYKTGAEQFTENTMSEETREEINFLLDDIYERLVTTISTARKLEKEKVIELLDIGLMTPAQAKKFGLIDHVVYKDDLLDRMGDQIRRNIELVSGYGEKKITFEEIDFFEMLNTFFKVPIQPAVEAKDKIALVYAEGMILPGSQIDYPFAESVIAEDDFVEMLSTCRAEGGIRAVVIRINSPGGSAASSDVIWHEIHLLARRKPVIVSMSDVAASGGYYIAMAGDTIFAEEGTITGSIGVLGMKVALNEFFEKIGVEKITVRRGKNAGILLGTDPLTPEQREILQQNMAAVYGEFTRKVREDRTLSEEELLAAAEGRIWTGAQAKRMKLVDEIGGLDAAIEAAQLAAGFGKHQDVEIEIYPPQLNFMELFQKLLSGNLPLSYLPCNVLEMKTFTSYIPLLQTIRKNCIMALMPCEIEIR